MNQNAVFYRFVNSLLRIMLAGALFLLLLHSLFSTGFLGKIVLEDGTLQERTLNIADTPSRHFFCLSSVPLRFSWHRDCGRR